MIDREAVRRMREQGMLPAEIAAVLGCSESSVQKIAKVLGLARAVGRRESRVDLRLLFELWQTQLSIAEIAGRLGVSKSTVWDLKIRHKLPDRTVAGAISQAEAAPSPCEEAASLSGLALSPWVEARARECREAHYAARRSELECNTSSKASKWNRGICLPQGHRRA
jgi:DNA-binding CsgD family transcriptional regulator